MFKNDFVGIVPMRAGSKGFPGKNPLLMPNTVSFLNQLRLKYYISTDIQEVLSDATLRELCVDRPPDLAKADTSIKKVITHFADVCDLCHETWVWLFYVTFPYRDPAWFSRILLECDALISDQPEIDSFMAFQSPRTHPYDLWKMSEDNKIEQRLFEGDWFRRQDKPTFWEHTHYVCGVKCSGLGNLNSELIGQNTYPIFLPDELSEQLVEIDCEADFDLARKLWRS